MRAIDTNILARFYVEDEQDKEAAKQRQIARRVMEHTPALFVPKTVVLELEWVMRGFYEFAPSAIADALENLLGLPNVTVEDHPSVAAAVGHLRRGLDFADALHLAASRGCTELLTFDRRRFAARARRLGLKPACTVPALPLRKERTSR